MMPAGDFLLGIGGGPYAVLIGLVIGALGGFFGVGGGFLMVPLLNVLLGVPYNLAVGSDLGQLFGMSTSATVRRMRFGQIDFKLAIWMIVGTVAGVEAGALLLEMLEDAGTVVVCGRPIGLLDVVMSLIYSGLLLFLGQAMIRESMRTMRRAGGRVEPPAVQLVSPTAMRFRTMKLWPMIGLPASGIDRVSLWVILLIGFATGLLTGLLGVGGGFLRLPALVYVLGCPIVVALATDLLEILFSSGYGVLTHALKGNVHTVLVLALLVGTAAGAQVGSSYTRWAGDPRARLGFGCLAFLGVIMVAGKLVLMLFSV